MNKFGVFPLLISMALVVAKPPYLDFHCSPGHSGIVQLFEWKWTDVELECVAFIGPNKYCAVQVSPPTEHITTKERSWAERYEPVSYRLASRSGDQTQFRDMVVSCNRAGVRVIVDIALNNMARDDRSGEGWARSKYNASAGDFPGIPYDSSSFHGCKSCPDCCCVIRWEQVDQVRRCRYENKMDLDQSLEYVQQTQSDFMNTLIDAGVAGFRIDSGRHMFPNHLEAIWNRLKYLNTWYFPPLTKAGFIIEVVDLAIQGHVSSFDYTSLGKISEFKFSRAVAAAVNDLSTTRFITRRDGMLDHENAIVFVDNHDTQRRLKIGAATLTFSHKQKREYQMAQALTVSIGYGQIRLMSSYEFDEGLSREGPPSDKDGRPLDVITHPNGTCGNAWVCEHRWPTILSLMEFGRFVANESSVRYWPLSADANKLVIIRGKIGLLAVTNLNKFDATIPTGLTAGIYCDVIMGKLINGRCQGSTMTVDESGTGQVQFYDEEIPFRAFHTGARVDLPVSTVAIDIETTEIQTSQYSPTELTTVPEATTVNDEITTQDKMTTVNDETMSSHDPLATMSSSARTQTENWTTGDMTTEVQVTSDEPSITPTVQHKTESTDSLTTSEYNTTHIHPATTEASTAVPTIKTDSSSTITTLELTSPIMTTTTLPTTSMTTKAPARRTIIFFKYPSTFKENVFFLGGIDHKRRKGCIRDAEKSPCAISIKHNTIGTSTHYNAYNSWKYGDTKLDWYGPQIGQGMYNKIPASGTPPVWTTNDRNHVGFNPLNRWGLHYWMLDVNMECDETFEGWFEIKGILNGIEESPIQQDAMCTGNAQARHPFGDGTRHHMAKCGCLNVFEVYQPSCLIDYLT